MKTQEGGDIFLLNQHMRGEVQDVDVAALIQESLERTPSQKEGESELQSEQKFSPRERFEQTRFFLKKEGHNLLGYIDFIASERQGEPQEFLLWKREVEQAVSAIDTCLTRLETNVGDISDQKEQELERVWLDIESERARLRDISRDVENSGDVLTKEQKMHIVKILGDMIAVLERLMPEEHDVFDTEKKR